MQIFELAGAREFLPQRRTTSDMYGQLCRRAPQVCVNSIEAICGYDTGNLNTSMLPLYLAYTPAGEACSCCKEMSFHRQEHLQLWGLSRCLHQSGKGGIAMLHTTLSSLPTGGSCSSSAEGYAFTAQPACTCLTDRPIASTAAHAILWQGVAAGLHVVSLHLRASTMCWAACKSA